MNLNKIHHIAFITSDYKRTKEFYFQKLGFEVVRENYRPERDDYKLDLRLVNSELEIFCETTPPARLSGPESCGLRHLAFAVDDVEQTVKELNDLGIETD